MIQREKLKTREKKGTLKETDLDYRVLLLIAIASTVLISALVFFRKKVTFSYCLP